MKKLDNCPRQTVAAAAVAAAVAASNATNAICRALGSRVHISRVGPIFSDRPRYSIHAGKKERERESCLRFPRQAEIDLYLASG